jgi:GNAT superfamily N-acetyltransferase
VGSSGVFVTGGTGYIGRPLVAELLRRGHSVRALVRPGSGGRLPDGARGEGAGDPEERRMTEWQRAGFTISTDRSKLDRKAIHEFLAGSYWATGIPQDVVDRSIEGSLCFGISEGGKQVGFARVITDGATFAYLADVYVLESHRGRGLAAWLMECILAHPELQGLRRWMLVTRDAHPLYRKSGFRDLAHPERIMEMTFPGIYQRR